MKLFRRRQSEVKWMWRIRESEMPVEICYENNKEDARAANCWHQILTQTGYVARNAMKKENRWIRIVARFYGDGWTAHSAWVFREWGSNLLFMNIALFSPQRNVEMPMITIADSTTPPTTTWQWASWQFPLWSMRPRCIDHPTQITKIDCTAQ